MRTSSFRSHAVTALWSLGFGALWLAQFRSLALDQIHAGSGGSWSAVLGEAGAGRYAFGSELFFTGGPLSLVYTQYFQPDAFGLYLAVSAAAVLFMTLGSVTLARRAHWALGVGWACALLLPLQRDALFLAIPLLAGVVGLCASGGGVLAVLALGAIVSAVVTLAKFSVLPIAVGAFVLVDLGRLQRRALPIALPLYALGLPLSFHAVSAERSSFGLYLRGSLETTSGYAAAMSKIGPRWELLTFLIALLVLLVVLGAVELRRARSVVAALRDAGPLGLLLLLFLWVAFKAEFVRDDRFHMTAYPALVLGAALFAWARRHPLLPALALLASASLLSSVAIKYPWGARKSVAPAALLGAAFSDGIAALGRELAGSARLLLTPSEVRAELLQQRRAALKATAKRSPLQTLDGSLGSMLAIQSSLIAAGLEFVPNPCISEYTAYTPWVIGRELELLRSARAPRYVLFSAKTIDRRYPAQTLGATWPELLSRYAPSSILPQGALLERRPVPLPDVLGTPRELTARFDAPLDLRGFEQPLFVQLDLQRSLLGRLVELVFRPPQLRIEVTLQDGSTRKHRLIPGIAQAGFVLSPYIAQPREFAELAQGRMSAAQRVTSVKLAGADEDFLPRRLGYRSAIRARVQAIDLAVLARATRGAAQLVGAPQLAGAAQQAGDSDDGAESPDAARDAAAADSDSPP